MIHVTQWLDCKSLWIKVSAKCINVNVMNRKSCISHTIITNKLSFQFLQSHKLLFFTKLIYKELVVSC